MKSTQRPETGRLTRRAARFLSGLMILGTLLFLDLPLVGQRGARGQTIIEPVQYFYVPIPEAEFRTYANAQSNPDSTENDIQRSVVSITATAGGTIVYYDQWEDGYEYDITNPTQSTTQIWGDNDPSNGIPPFFATDTVNAGTVITLDNDVPCSPRDQGNLFWDGRDKFASTQQLVVTHAMWPTGTVQTPPGTIGAMLAGAVEVFEVARWGIAYDVPVGTNLTGLPAGFNWVALSIMASQDGTTVNVDKDANNVFETTVTLNEGETYFAPTPVLVGARVTADAPVQVNLLTCQSPSGFNGRLYPLIPTTYWGDTYYSPVHWTRDTITPQDVPCQILIFNPSSTASITVTATTLNGSTPITVTARQTAFFAMPAAGTTVTGARFQSAGAAPFYALAAIDMNGTVHNWGFTLIPRTSLTTSVVVGWAPGSVDQTMEASPLWVTPDANTTVYVDYDGNPATPLAGPTDIFGNHYDVSYSLNALQSLRILDPAAPYDHTSYRLYTVNDARLAVVWGQDGTRSSTGQPNQLDLGTTIIPYPTITAYKSAELIGDYNGNGGVDPGEVLSYSIRIHNSGIVPIDQINVRDTLDPQVTYVAGTTTLDDVPIADHAAPNVFPLDPANNGYDLSAPKVPLDPGDPDIYITFLVTVGSPFTGEEINNQVKVTSVAEIFLNALVNVVQTGTLATTKTSSALPPGQTAFLPGDTVTYTVTVRNTSAVKQTGIMLDDPLPEGTTYVAQSTSVTGRREKVVQDVFDKLLYSNDDGPETWAGDWTEHDLAGGTPIYTTGDVQVINGELRLFNSGSYAQRIVNLSEFTGESATLSFNWRINPLVDAGDQALVQISTNGTAWTTLGTITGTAGPQSGSLSYDISNYISATTYVRFSASTGYAAGEYFYVDKVTVQAALVTTAKTATDNFASGNYTGGSGWAGNWTDVDGRPNNPAATQGNVTINNQRLRIENRTYTNQSAQRTVDLSIPPGRSATATLQFDFWTAAVYAVGETADVSISSDGGTNWNVLDTFTPNTTQTTKNYTITSWISATTTVRFRTNTIGSANGHYFYFDNVTITETKPQVITKDNIPVGTYPDLVNGTPPDPVTLLPAGPVVQADGFALAPAETMTMTYRVTVNSPATVNRLVNTVTATSWEKAPPSSATTVDPVKPGGTIGDLVWLDASGAPSGGGDGIWQVGEPGIYNVRVWLDTNGNGTYDAGTDKQTTTDANGRYIFTSLRPGTYRVYADETTLPAGLVRTTAGNPMGPITVTGAGNEQFLTNDFGYGSAAGTAVLGDRVWSDQDADGIQDPGDVGITGIYVSLADTPGTDGIWGTPDDHILRTTVTSANGTYFFVGVAPGTYRILAGTGADGVLGTGDDQLNSPWTPVTGPQSEGSKISSEIVANAGQTINTIDFGFHSTATYTVTDRFWFDMDSDGAADAGEPGLDGVTVNIFNSLGVMIGSGMTDANGYVTFGGMGNGTYTLRVEDANGRLLGFGGTTAAAVAGAQTVTVAGGDVTGTHFGYNAPGMIGDTVWSDANSNGVRDNGEAGISGVTVQLYNDINGNGVYDAGTDTLAATTTTNGSGWYQFQVNTPGRFFVNVATAPGGGTLTTPDDEAAAGAQRQVDLLNLDTGWLTADFGYNLSALPDLSGNVFDDVSGNGIDEGAGEPGMAGVTLDLIRPGADNIFGTADDLVASTTTTDANGNYVFQDLANGSYRVKVTDTSYILSGYQVTTGLDYEEVTVAGASITGVDFGYHKYSPTRALLTRFSASVRGGRTVVEWETAAEFGTAGFDLYRLDNFGEYVRVNEGFLPGLLVAPQGGTYTLVDRDAPASGRVTYLLVEREARGGRIEYGPFSITLQRAAGAAAPALDYQREAHERPVPAASDAAAMEPESALPGDVIRAAVTENGFYTLDAATIGSLLGYTPTQIGNAIRSGLLTVLNGGRAVAYRPLERNSAIGFYGQAIDSPYTAQNVYQVLPGRGRKMVERSVATVTPSGSLQTFRDTAHAEQDVWALTALFTDPAADYWVWNYIVAGDPTEGSREFTVATPGKAAVSGPATLAVRCVGESDTPANPEYHVKLYVNGTYAGEARWDGTAPYNATVSFPQALLREGDNTIRVAGILDAGVEYSIFYIDSLDITYGRLYRAAGERLFCRGDGNAVVSVAGFAGSDPKVYDLTEPARPVFLIGALVDQTADGYRVSFAPAAAATPYLVCSSAGQNPPDAVTAFQVSTLKQRTNRADYVIVAPASLAAAAEPLAQHRRGQGLTVMTVDLQQIYDTFGYSLSGPQAIRDFMAYARANWKLAPRYLLLAGDGSNDFKNNEGYGDCLLPPFMVGTPYGIFASDRPFGDVAGDSVPEIAVGRLPVLTAGELQAVTDKIRAYETAPADYWTRTALMLADNPDAGGAFTVDSDAVAAIFPAGYDAVPLYLSQWGLNTTRTLLFDGLDEGAVLLNYMGHASPFQLADEGLLTMADAGDLNTAPRLPVFAAFTCLAGMFEASGVRVIGEGMLLQPDGGAVAVWAPTGLSEQAQAKILDEALVRALFANGTRPLGAALQQAQREFITRGGSAFILDIYNLLGDPALRVK